MCGIVIKTKYITSVQKLKTYMCVATHTLKWTNKYTTKPNHTQLSQTNIVFPYKQTVFFVSPVSIGQSSDIITTIYSIHIAKWEHAVHYLWFIREFCNIAKISPVHCARNWRWEMLITFSCLQKSCKKFVPITFLAAHTQELLLFLHLLHVTVNPWLDSSSRIGKRLIKTK